MCLIETQPLQKQLQRSASNLYLDQAATRQRPHIPNHRRPKLVILPNPHQLQHPLHSPQLIPQNAHVSYVSIAAQPVEGQVAQTAALEAVDAAGACQLFACWWWDKLGKVRDGGYKGVAEDVGVE